MAIRTLADGWYPQRALTAKPESRAREEIDRQLTDAGWIVQDRVAAILSAGPGVAVIEFPLAGCVGGQVAVGYDTRRGDGIDMTRKLRGDRSAAVIERVAWSMPYPLLCSL